MSSSICPGFKVNYLTAIRHIKGSVYLWCCDCGNEVIEEAWRILSGHKKTCGRQCVTRQQINAQRKLVHGDSVRGTVGNHRYVSWINMKSRCGNKSNKSYADYGGRGIAVCDRWQQSYLDFAHDMESPPRNDYAAYQLERIDVDGHYEPSNVRWATRVEQARNKRNTVKVSVDGENVLIAEASEKFGIKPKTLSYRLRAGIPVDRALNEPLGMTQIEQARRRDAILVATLSSGRVKVHEDGRIIDLGAGRAMKPTSDRDGYLKVKIPGIAQKLRQPGLSGTYRHHRVVALAHVQNPDPERRYMVGHKNHNRADNRASNLEWQTPQQNALDRHSEAEPPSEGALDYFSDVIYTDLLLQHQRPEKPPKYTDASPRPISGTEETRKVWSLISKQAWFNGSDFDAFPASGEQILGAPSNKMEISGDIVTLCVQAMDGRIKRIPLGELGRTHRVFWGCLQCGYEEPTRVAVRERTGDRGPAGNPCRICGSLALIYPELDRLRRPDPVSHKFPNGLNFPARKHGLSAFFIVGFAVERFPFHVELNS